MMLNEWTTTGWEQIALIALSAAAMYVTVILLTRLAGVRSFSKMSGFDFAVTVAIGSVLGSVILSKTRRLPTASRRLFSCSDYRSAWRFCEAASPACNFWLTTSRGSS
ncbi:hypothetical protein [Sphingopyxis sp. BSNA05]|uniref:hypothetical protein n=1 Tax=Sphingopyxis sp. BSNA05 TaxID=1236614 RepID=UPI001C26DBA8|nr:hypothetical protein [Sphingopyxis sp. BSNA05]